MKKVYVNNVPHDFNCAHVINQRLSCSCGIVERLNTMKANASGSKLKTPPDPERMNDTRAEWAARSLDTFMSDTGAEDETAMYDLLADFAHLCDRRGWEFGAMLRLARMHYEEETANKGKQQFCA